MKNNPERAKRKVRTRHKVPKTLEREYRKVFSAPLVQIPARERRSMYTSVPSITTYGLCGKPI